MGTGTAAIVKGDPSESNAADDRTAADSVCFSPPAAHVPRRMSLNRSEQLVSDYVASHPEEKSFWIEKVQSAAREGDEQGAAARLADQLWDYFEERAGVAEPFRSIAQREGLRRTSMRNLAEYWLRLWSPVKPRPPKPGVDAGKTFSR